MNLDELKVTVDKLKALLDDQQTGLMSWWSLLNERIEELKKQILEN